MSSRGLIVVSLLWVGTLQAATDPGLAGMVPPDANFLMGLRVSAIADSPLAQFGIEQAKQSEKNWASMLNQLGPNPLAGIEEVLLAATMAPGEREASMDDAVVLLKGNFADNRFMEALCSSGCESAAYRSLEIRSGGSGENQAFFVKLDGRYAALGAEERLKAAVDRKLDGGGAGTEAITGWVGDLSNRHLWFAAKGPFETPDVDTDSSAAMFAGAAENLDGVGFGMTLGADVEFGLELKAKSPAAADGLHQMLAALVGMMALAGQGEGGEQQPGAAMLQKVQLSRNASFVTASLRVPGDEIMQQMRAAIESSGSEEAVQVESAPPQVEEPIAAPVRKPIEKPRERGVIRIYGLGAEPIELRPDGR